MTRDLELRRFLAHCSPDVQAENAGLIVAPRLISSDTTWESEEAMQIRLMQMVEACLADYPDLAMLYHVPNGGARSKATGGRLKAMGVKRGVYDLSLDVARGGWHGLRMELKLLNNALTPEQRSWSDALRTQGYLPLVRYRPDVALQTMLEYLDGKWIRGNG